VSPWQKPVLICCINKKGELNSYAKINNNNVGGLVEFWIFVEQEGSRLGDYASIRG
jgi:hypothetical protein